MSRPEMSKDFSVTAWGEDGSVEVQVQGKVMSDNFPYVAKDDSSLPPNEQGFNVVVGGGTDTPADNTADDATAEAAADMAETYAADATAAASLGLT